MSHFPFQDFISYLKQRIYGQRFVIEQSLVALLCQGHALLTGTPGVAKTTLVRNIATALGKPYSRIQFTPDLTPFDILGGETLTFNPEHGKAFAFSPGPVFTSFLVADEINRASPRTQAALLEAMQERQVTLSGTTYVLPQPFYVFATQNPIEHEGTFPLPEAQLDRFLLNIMIPYPDFQTELQIAKLHHDLPPLEPFGHPLEEVLFQVEKMPLSRVLEEAIVRLVRSTRPQETSLKSVQDSLLFGASPRASQALLKCSKALAMIRGEKEVSFEHIRTLFFPVLRHRCVLNFKAISQGLTCDHILQQVLDETIV